MLKRYLDEAMSILDELISVTKTDIENIKQAKHSTVDESVAKKNLLIKNFENTKRELDKELVNLSKTSTNLTQTLDEETRTKLLSMRQKLEKLNEVNKEYSRHILVVKEFFDSLSREIFNVDNNSYTKNSDTSSFYKTKV